MRNGIRPSIFLSSWSSVDGAQGGRVDGGGAIIGPPDTSLDSRASYGWGRKRLDAPLRLTESMSSAPLCVWRAAIEGG